MERLDEWNNANPYHKLTKTEEGDFINLKELENVKKYADFIKAKHGDSFYLIIVDEVINDGNVFEDFTFIGYDCGYIYDDDNRDWYVLFSCIKNELLKQPEHINQYLRSSYAKLNKYGLFQSFGDALKFKNRRDLAKMKGDINGIELNFSDFDFSRIWLYDKTNPFITP